MNFSSENFDKVHPTILKALLRCNKGFVPSYGNDNYTQKVIAKFKEVLGHRNIEVFFCFNGTGANNFALSAVTERCHSVFCADVSHLYTAESTAPEAFSGCRLYPLKSKNGKIITDDITPQVTRLSGVHCPRAALLTISQPTEYGTVYTLPELKLIARTCKQNNLLLHIDGARIFNALAALNCSFKEFVHASGVDALTIGGTKSGLMFGEAVVFFRSGRFNNLAYSHKRSMQLASKNRFIAAQFHELLKQDLWKRLAGHTNGLASYFVQEMKKTGAAQLAHPVQTNVVFMNIPFRLFHRLSAAASFYMWDSEKEEVRFVFSPGNTKKEIDLFLKTYKKAIA